MPYNSKPPPFAPHKFENLNDKDFCTLFNLNYNVLKNVIFYENLKYKCLYCGFGFEYKCDRDNHSKTHSETTIYNKDYLDFQKTFKLVICQKKMLTLDLISLYANVNGLCNKHGFLLRKLLQDSTFYDFLSFSETHTPIESSVKIEGYVGYHDYGLSLHQGGCSLYVFEGQLPNGN